MKDLNSQNSKNTAIEFAKQNPYYCALIAGLVFALAYAAWGCPNSCAPGKRIVSGVCKPC